MLTEKEFKSIEKNGITFKLSHDGKYANVYKKGVFKSSIFSTNNTVFFCGKEFVETTTKDILEYLKKNTIVSNKANHLSRDEIFMIWKRCMLENRPVKSFEIELQTNDGYLYCAFRSLKLPRTIMERKMFDQELLKKVMAQTCYADAKVFLTQN